MNVLNGGLASSRNHRTAVYCTTAILVSFQIKVDWMVLFNHPPNLLSHYALFHTRDNEDWDFSSVDFHIHSRPRR